MTQEVVDRLLVPIQSNLFTMDPPVALFSGAIHGPRNDFEKHSIFKPVSKTEKTPKNHPQDPQKTTKNDHQITKKLFLRKHGFRNNLFTKIML